MSFVCPWENEAFPTGATIWREPARDRCQSPPSRSWQAGGPPVCGGLICATCGRCQHCKTWHAAALPGAPTLGALTLAVGAGLAASGLIIAFGHVLIGQWP